MKDKLVPEKDKKTLGVCCILCALFLCAPHLPAQTDTNPVENEILAIGTGVIVGGNQAAAKETAISQALIKGLEDYLVYRMGRQVLVNNFQRFTHEVIPGAKEAIENFHILAESQVGDKYKILVRLKINERIIDENLKRAGLLLVEVPRIKMLFLISEESKGQTLCWWENPEIHSPLSPIELALHNGFQKKGFTPINRTLNILEDKISDDLRSPDLGDKAALRWGALLSADVVIRGQAKTVDDKKISLTLEAFDVDQGVQICRGMHSEPLINGPKGKEQMAETIERLVNHLVTRLAPVIIQASTPDQEKVHHLDVTLTGLKSYNQFREFRDFLIDNVTGVISVKQTRVKKDSISIEVEFRGDGNRFIDSVLNHRNLPFSLDFDQTEEGEILLDIIK